MDDAPTTAAGTDPLDLPDEADVVVLGLGIAGEAVAGALAEEGLTVVGVDAGLVGGECPYWGCIPSKMMIRAANALAEARRVPALGGKVEVTPDWQPVSRRIREQATDDWDDRVAVERFEKKGGIFVRARGRLEGPDGVRIGDVRVRARRGVVIATGTRPAVPPIPGIDSVEIWTNREVATAQNLPASVVVLGAGAIGTELAQVMARFGTRVVIVEALDRILPLEEPEASAVLTEAFRSEGIEVHTGRRAVRVEPDSADGDGVRVHLDDGTELVAERLLVATGRATDLAGIGADTIGVDPTARFVPVDDHLRVTDGVWAVGDITGKGLFTHVGAHQARIVVADICGRDSEPFREHAIPRVTFTDPEVGSVGLSEAAARDAGLDVAVAVQPVPHTARGWLHAVGNEGVIKLVVDTHRDVLVGATSVGPHGGEVLSMLALAVHAAVPLGTLRSMIYAYPTFHRGVEDALGQL